MKSQTPPNVRVAMQRLDALPRQRADLYNDPMSAYCTCLSDFADDYDRRERALAAYIVARSPAGCRRHAYAMGKLEAYLP